MSTDLQPESLTVHQQSGELEIRFTDASLFRIPFELMRVYSPSAEVKGHGPGQEVLQQGKRGIGLLALEPVGHYAVKPLFSDGHDTGIFTWAYLHFLATQQSELWQQYEARLLAAGLSRDAATLASPPAANVSGCGSF